MKLRFCCYKGSEKVESKPNILLFHMTKWATNIWQQEQFSLFIYLLNGGAVYMIWCVLEIREVTEMGLGQQAECRGSALMQSCK